MTVFRSVRGEFQISTPLGPYSPQGPVFLTPMSNGGYMIARTDYGTGAGVKAQIYDASGAIIVNDILIANFSTGYSTLYGVNILSDGRPIIFWKAQNFSDPVGSYEIRAQTLNPDGTKSGGEINVFSVSQSMEHDFHFAELNNGGFVATWYDFTGALGDNSFGGIHGQVYDSQGTKLGAEFLVNTQTHGFQQTPCITSLSNGNFVICWNNQAGDFRPILAQMFTSDGTKIGSEIVVNSSPFAFRSQEIPTITALPNGSFAISSTSFDVNGGPGDIRVQIFASDGSKIGQELVVNTTQDGDQRLSAISSLPNGDIVIVWQEDGNFTGGNNAMNTKLRMYHPDGSPFGTEFLVSSQPGSPGNRNIYASVAGLADGGFVVGCLDLALPNFGAESVRVEQFSLDTSSLTGSDADDWIIGFSSNDILYGDDGSDSLDGGAGDDNLDGGLGTDRMAGGLGDDKYYIDDVGDTVVENVSEGTDELSSSISISLSNVSANLENLTLIGAGSLDGAGNALANVLNGNSGNNNLDGGAEDDSLIGGFGDDVLDGGSGSDTLDGGDGNDRIYWDAADDPANITAGAGIDRLVMKDSSTLPSFSYATQGFELLEIETNDLGGSQNWSRQSQTYNLALQLVEYATHYDDGSRVAVTLDPGNANATNQLVSYYDMLDRLVQVDQVNDDASRVIFNYDPAGASVLSFDIIYCDNLGRLDRWDQNYDSGSRIAIDYDQANTTPLSSSLVYYDDQNRLDRWTQNYDIGSRAVIDYDQTNASALSSSLVYYDSQSRIDLWDQNYDDGSRVVIDYDQANASAFSSSLVYYDTQSRLDRWDQNYDDGSRVVIDYDATNASSLANELLYFDTQARIDLWDRNYDDGSRILVDFDQDNSQAWNQHVMTYNTQGALVGDVFI